MGIPSLRLLPLALLLTACSGSSDGKDGDGTGDDTASAAGITREEAITVTTPYTGDTTCFSGEFTAQTPGAGCTADQALSAEVNDFQSGDAVGQADVEFWFSDDIDASTDFTGTAADDGTLSLTAPACTAVAYRTSTPAEWEQTKDTFEVHQVYGWDGGSTTDTLNSVSVATSQLIPALLGLSWLEDSTGIIAGTAYDCNEDPIQNVQVFIHDGDGVQPEGIAVRYFNSSDLPVAIESQPATNSNGLWVAINVPEGTWTVEMWGTDGSAQVMLGQTILNVKPSSVYISNIYTGSDTGVFLPPSCLATCE